MDSVMRGVLKTRFVLCMESHLIQTRWFFYGHISGGCLQVFRLKRSWFVGRCSCRWWMEVQFEMVNMNLFVECSHCMDKLWMVTAYA